MRKSIQREFGETRPRALVLDDNPRARVMTERKLRASGFDVVVCKSVADFKQVWAPGTFDVIISDWQLSNDRGDAVLEDVRERDWDVPFVLVSGKLREDGKRAPVLERLLARGAAKFVERGNKGIEVACREAEVLIERRDLALLHVILSLRPAVLAKAKIATSAGQRTVADLLGEIVSKPRKSHNAERGIVEAWAQSRSGEK